MALHQQPLGHVSIGVRDYHISKTFYTALLTPLGLRLVYDRPPVADATGCFGFGPNAEKELLTLFVRDNAQAAGPGCHIAFNAATRKAVEDFHAAGIASGGTSTGEPGLRPRYGPNYFAAFVTCPDGWKIEAVCKATGEA